MLFGVFSRDDQKFIKRIPQTIDVEKETIETFSSQAIAFFSDGAQQLKQVEFQAGQTQTEESVLFIDDFDDVLRVREAINTETKNPAINFEHDLPYLKGLFMADNESRILFQLVEGRRVMTPGSWLGVIFGLEKGNHQTLAHLNAAGLSIDSKLTAVMEGKKLFFKSFRNASRIFDLSGYLAEASEEGTINFLKSPSLYVNGSEEEFAKNFSKSQMRKIPKIMAYGYLQKYAPDELRKRALMAKPPINLKIKENRLVVPEDSDERAVMLDFLSNSIFSSHLDDATDYKSESHYPIKRNVK